MKKTASKTTTRITIEISRPGPNPRPWKDWNSKEVRVSIGPTANDLFDVLATSLQPPKTKNYAFLVGFEERGYTAAMTVRLSMSGQVFAKARSPFLTALWRPMVCGIPEAPSAALAQFSKRSIFSGRIGSAYRAETPVAQTKEKQEDTLLEAFRGLPTAEQQAVIGLLATGRPSIFLPAVARR